MFPRNACFYVQMPHLCRVASLYPALSELSYLSFRGRCGILPSVARSGGPGTAVVVVSCSCICSKAKCGVAVVVSVVVVVLVVVAVSVAVIVVVVIVVAVMDLKVAL